LQIEVDDEASPLLQIEVDDEASALSTFTQPVSPSLS
jgi:hypothetical protein